MTRSLSLLIQIVLHAIPATLMGWWISGWCFPLIHQLPEWDAPIKYAPPYMLVFGCFTASLCLVTAGSSSILSGSRRSGTFCAFAVPFFSGIPWLTLHSVNGDIGLSIFPAFFGSAISSLFAVPVQSFLSPRIARRCEEVIQRRSTKDFLGVSGDPFTTPLLVLIHSVPGCYLTLLVAWSSSKSVPSVTATIVAAAFALASCVWVNSLHRHMQNASVIQNLVAGAACGVLIPIFAAVGVAIYHQGMGPLMACSIALGTIAPMLAFTLPAQALLTPMALGAGVRPLRFVPKMYRHT